VLCVYLIVWVFALKPTKSILDVLIERSLRRFYRVRIVDYETVLRTEDGYSVMQVVIEDGNELVGSTLAGAQLGSRGVLVLNIKRASGDSIGTPHPTTEVMSGDQLTVYGQERVIPEVLMSTPKSVTIES
jgi:Trk K+ transport system NAD-binding subunit